ncbi:MAG: PAS domain S-box protein [Gemmatimonadales bacterium]
MTSTVHVQQQLARRLDQIEALGRVAHALTGVDDAEQTMQFVAVEGARVFQAQRAAVYLLDRRRESLDCMVALGLSTRYVEAVTRSFRELPAARAVMSGEPRFTPEAQTDPDYPLRREALEEGFSSVAVLPLVFGGESIGSLAFYHDRPREYTDDERRLASAFADQAALAIGKSRLLDQVSRIKREWQSAFDGTGSGLALVESGGQILRGNRFLADLARIPVTELPGLDLRTLFPAWPEPARDPLLGALAAKVRTSALMDGPEGRHLVVTATPRPEGGLVVAVDDLTELVRLEERFSGVVQTAHDAIVIASLDGRISFANRAAMELFGLPLSELLGSALADRLPETLGAPSRPSGEVGPARARRYESEVRRPDGVRYIAVSSAPLEERGTLAGVVAVARDVTQERLAGEALRRSEARFRALFAAAPLAIFTVDQEGRFQSVNHAAVRLFGPAQGVGDVLRPGEVDHVNAQFRASFRGETRDFIFHFTRPDGQVREAAAISVPVEEIGGARAVLTLARDVTDEVQLRERLTHSEKMAALGQLVSGVAHELNNPLAGIAALAQALALDPTVDEGAVRISHTIRGEAMRAARIVSDLLTFARQRPLRRQDVDLNTLVREALETSPNFGRDGIHWELALSGNLPVVSLDAEQIRQVLGNLLANAAHAMRGSPARLGSIRTYWTDEIVGCEVADSGPGVAPEALQRIFEPFFTTKNVGEGTGLGLSISHGIIRAHGGDIGVRHRAEGGARFWFELPRAGARGPRVDDG